jgi:hypothetical protein
VSSDDLSASPSDFAARVFDGSLMSATAIVAVVGAAVGFIVIHRLLIAFLCVRLGRVIETEELTESASGSVSQTSLLFWDEVIVGKHSSQF